MNPGDEHGICTQAWSRKQMLRCSMRASAATIRLALRLGRSSCNALDMVPRYA